MLKPPVKASQKKGRPASGPTRPGGKTPEQIVRASNRWRDHFNPLRGLVISKVVSMLEAAERGDFAELQLTMRKIERRYPVYKALRSRRLSAMGELDWDIKIVSDLPEGTTEAMADAQAQYLRSRYELIENIREAINFLALAEFRGYSILQKHYYQDGEHDGAVREFHWLPQWNFCRDGQFGDWYYNKDATFGISPDSLSEANRIGGNDLPREEFIIRECDVPLYEIALIAFVNWSMARKDWAAFVEIFGLPSAIVIMPGNIPTDKEEDYQAAAEKVADGASGALPNGSDAKFPTASVRGNAPFKEFSDMQDADVVLAGTGGLLTMLSMPTGIGQGASDEHGDAFAKIASAEAKDISEIFQRNFDEPGLDVEFPGQPHLAYFELAADESDDENTITDRIQKLENCGWQTDEQEVSEKTGLKVTRKVAVAAPLANDPANPENPAPGMRPFGPRGSIQNREAGDTPAATLASALSEDLQPFFSAIAERLDRVMQITDPNLRLQKFRELWAETESLRNDITADPKTARVIEQANAQAMAKGLTQ